MDPAIAVDPFVRSPPFHGATPARATRQARSGRGSTVAEWKRQVTWFAAAMTALVVLVAGASAGALLHVLREVAQLERQSELRGRAATAARVSVLEVDRALAQTIAVEDPAAMRSAAIASIAAAASLEEAVNALRAVFGQQDQVTRLVQLVEEVRAPRMQVVALARKGERAQAVLALNGIAESLKKIDNLSVQVVEVQADNRLRAAGDRDTLFGRLLYGLGAAAAASVLLALAFYRRLMQRLARADEVEQLLEEVGRSVAELDEGGGRLDGLTDEVRTTYGQLRHLLDGLQGTSVAMTQEAQTCLADLDQLGRTCATSAVNSRQHAQESAVVVSQIRSTTSRMHQLLGAADALRRSRSDIAGLADQIAGISATTRLLSLNAAVEAARAGAAGRGFGVIASSVRQLSEDTQQAAAQIRKASDEITAQLTATTAAARETSSSMDDCARRVTALDDSARANQALVDGMAGEVQGFHRSFERQVERIQAIEHDAQTVAGALREGDRHGELLATTSAALGATSANLMQRLSGLQN